jgi:ABC-type multidrug transport system, ATPase component
MLKPLAPALDLIEVTFAYGARRALSEVSLRIEPGETVILLGPNGAGKTTLFSIVCGLFVPTAGYVGVAGLDLRDRRTAALGALGIVFQQQTLDLDLSVRQNLAYYCRLRGIPKADAARRITAELERLKMAERIDERVRDLNGGHRRRVEIARAMLDRPRILLLDEPTVGLDIPTRRELIAYLHARRRGRHRRLWATHLIDEVAETDRVVVLHKGRIAASGTPAQLRDETGAASLDGAFASLTSTEPTSKEQPA